MKSCRLEKFQDCGTVTCKTDVISHLSQHVFWPGRNYISLEVIYPDFSIFRRISLKYFLLLKDRAEYRKDKQNMHHPTPFSIVCKVFAGFSFVMHICHARLLVIVGIILPPQNVSSCRNSSNASKTQCQFN